MRRLYKLAIPSILFLMSFASVAAQEDRYSTDEVKALLQQSQDFSSSFSEKQLSRLGDRISIALMKIYSEKELIDPQNMKRYLPLIVNAFRFPKLIAENDKEPR